MSKSQINTIKEESLAHQIIKLGRIINELGLESSKKKFGLETLSQTHLDLFPHIDFEGTSITEIAHRKGVSKQAMSKLVGEMVDMELLELKSDPKDARAKKVFFKTKGPFAIQKGMEVLKQIDKLLVGEIGKKSYGETLSKISRLLEVVQKENVFK